MERHAKAMQRNWKLIWSKEAKNEQLLALDCDTAAFEQKYCYMFNSYISMFILIY